MQENVEWIPRRIYGSTVMPRYNAVVERHVLGPPYKRDVLWHTVDLFDIVIPRHPTSQAKAWSWTCMCNHSYSAHARVA